MVLKSLKPLYLAFAHVFKRTFTIKSPFVMLKPMDRTTGRLQLHMDRCVACRLCARICPTNAIEMVETEMGYRPQIDFGKCIISCQICSFLCPRAALTTTSDYELADYKKEALVYTPKRLSIPPDVRKGRKMVVPKFYKRRGVSHVPV